MVQYMYRTRVRTVAAGGIIDDSGRYLAVMGRLPVQPGDMVYTDGNVVYGHSPLKEGRHTKVLSGIPIAIVGKEGNAFILKYQGYISSSGVFHEYKFAKPPLSYIVNNTNRIVKERATGDVLDAFLSSNNDYYTTKYSAYTYSGDLPLNGLYEIEGKCIKNDTHYNDYIAVMKNGSEVDQIDFLQFFEPFYSEIMEIYHWYCQELKDDEAYIYKSAQESPNPLISFSMTAGHGFMFQSEDASEWDAIVGIHYIAYLDPYARFRKDLIGFILAHFNQDGLVEVIEKDIQEGIPEIPNRLITSISDTTIKYIRYPQKNTWTPDGKVLLNATMEERRIISDFPIWGGYRCNITFNSRYIDKIEVRDKNNQVIFYDSGGITPPYYRYYQRTTMENDEYPIGYDDYGIFHKVDGNETGYVYYSYLTRKRQVYRFPIPIVKRLNSEMYLVGIPYESYTYLFSNGKKYYMDIPGYLLNMRFEKMTNINNARGGNPTEQEEEVQQ